MVEREMEFTEFRRNSKTRAIAMLPLQGPLPPGRSTHIAEMRCRVSGRMYAYLVGSFRLTQWAGSVDPAGGVYRASGTRDEFFLDPAGLRV